MKSAAHHGGSAQGWPRFLRKGRSRRGAASFLLGDDLRRFCACIQRFMYCLYFVKSSLYPHAALINTIILNDCMNCFNELFNSSFIEWPQTCAFGIVLRCAALLCWLRQLCGVTKAVRFVCLGAGEAQNHAPQVCHARENRADGERGGGEPRTRNSHFIFCSPPAEFNRSLRLLAE